MSTLGKGRPRNREMTAGIISRGQGWHDAMEAKRRFDHTKAAHEQLLQCLRGESEIPRRSARNHP